MMWSLEWNQQPGHSMIYGGYYLLEIPKWDLPWFFFLFSFFFFETKSLFRVSTRILPREGIFFVWENILTKLFGIQEETLKGMVLAGTQAIKELFKLYCRRNSWEFHLSLRGKEGEMERGSVRRQKALCCQAFDYKKQKLSPKVAGTWRLNCLI